MVTVSRFRGYWVHLSTHILTQAAPDNQISCSLVPIPANHQNLMQYIVLIACVSVTFNWVFVIDRIVISKRSRSDEVTGAVRVDKIGSKLFYGDRGKLFCPLCNLGPVFVMDQFRKNTVSRHLNSMMIKLFKLLLRLLTAEVGRLLKSEVAGETGESSRSGVKVHLCKSLYVEWYWY